MAIQIGTVDGLINITEEKILCFVNAIEAFSKGGIEIARKNGLSLGQAFQRYVDPVYNNRSKDFSYDAIKDPVLTRTGKEQTPARATFCKKMGLLNIQDSKGIFELTPLGKALLDKIIRIPDYAFILLSKQGVFVNDKYKRNLICVIADWLQNHATISDETLQEFVKSLFGNEESQKTRLDIILNALSVAQLLTNVDRGVFSISDIYAADIFRLFLTHEKNISVALRDDEDGFISYIGALQHGIFDIRHFDDRNVLAIKFPNLAAITTPPILNVSSNYIGEISPTILYGPPGTGKTYALQHRYLDKFDESLTEFTTFHQSFSYEEFVEGLKPTLGDFDNVSYNIEKGVFYRACEKAVQLAGYNSLQDAIKASNADRKQKFSKAIADKKLALLCIDEINRGNVASIFGDLISLIEPSKRLGNKDELILTLPYSKESFGVPSNLMIVGTMNTADRSIQLLDSALRRRFIFEELPPVLESISYAPAKNVLRAINKRIRAILNKDAQIGHAYFIDVASDEETLNVIVKKVIPLLEEYFYNDIDKIRFVLNDYGETAKFYLEDKETREAYEHYTEVADMDSEEKKFFYLNPLIPKSDFSTISSNDFIKQVIG